MATSVNQEVSTSLASCFVATSATMVAVANHYLKEWRDFRGLSQEQLAEAAKPSASKSAISKLEKGKRKLTAAWMRRLAPPLGIDPGDFFRPPSVEARPMQDLRVIAREVANQVKVEILNEVRAMFADLKAQAPPSPTEPEGERANNGAKKKISSS